MGEAKNKSEGVKALQALGRKLLPDEKRTALEKLCDLVLRLGRDREKYIIERLPFCNIIIWLDTRS